MTINQNILSASWRAWISYDRSQSGPWWLPWVSTLLLAAAVALFFTFLNVFAFAGVDGAGFHLDRWVAWYGRNFVISLTVSAVIHLLFDLGRATVAKPERVSRWAPWQRTVYFTSVPNAGLLLGWPLGMKLVGVNLWAWIGGDNGGVEFASSIAFALGITLVLHHFFATKNRQYQAERNATEARLRLLQAQIEPHFLFNTLANVSALIEDDGPKAREMLDTFTDYLRASLASLRHDDTPLHKELELVRAYLDLLKMRMGDRLQMRIDADTAAGAVRLPPLLLQPLVENAVHHGLEAKVEGGTVSVSAQVDGSMLTLTVTDDGLGMDAPPRRQRQPNRDADTGLALQNLRARLQARYGSQASLQITAANPGTRATIRLPLEQGPNRCSP